jgi:putative transposase
LEDLLPSIGTVGDALDNALAETTIGLYKTECVRDGSPFRHGPLATLADLEEATSAWVHWYDTQRLMHRLGRIPPVEAEALYTTTIDSAASAVHKELRCASNPGCFSRSCAVDADPDHGRELPRLPPLSV